MKKQQIEHWALEVVESVKNGYKIEDNFIELKSRWVDPVKAARRIAGHANAARGNDIIWLIGVDEDSGLQQFEQIDFVEWWEKVKSNFTSLPPALTHLNIRLDDGNISVLHFETYNAPYVIKNPHYGKPKGGAIEREIPWRSGTSTKSANREDLLRMLVPLKKLPEVEFLECKAIAKIKEAEETIYEPVSPEIRREPHIDWKFYFTLYITPNNESIVLPVHRSKFKFKLKGIDSEFINAQVLKYHTPTKFMGRGSKIDSHTINTTNSEAIINGPGRLKVRIEHYELEREIESGNDLIFEFSVRPSGIEYEINKTLILPFTSPKDSPSERQLNWEIDNIETDSYWKT